MAIKLSLVELILFRFSVRISHLISSSQVQCISRFISQQKQLIFVDTPIPYRHLDRRTKHNEQSADKPSCRNYGAVRTPLQHTQPKVRSNISDRLEPTNTRR